MLLGLSVVPAIGFAVAAFDTRLGFRLIMASVGLIMCVMIVALLLRVRGLQPGVIRIDATGGLRFVPPRTHRAGLVAVPLSLLLPVGVLFWVRVAGLPTQASSSRFMASAPYVLLAVSLVSLALIAWSMRVPVGLRVGPSGISGVRGNGVLNLDWGDIASASPVGEYGPKLGLVTSAGDAVLIDAHHLGSDPAIVARILEFYRSRPARRAELEDGRAAITAVERACGAGEKDVRS